MNGLQNVIKAAVTGNYPPMGDPAQADCIIGHGFGRSVEPGSVNAQIAAMAVDLSQGRPLLFEADIELARAADAPEPAMVVTGPVSNAVGGGTGAWGALEQAQQYMLEHDLKHPMLIGQAFHIGRVAILQARKLGLNPIVPQGLPRDFDNGPGQYWTASVGVWIPREYIGMGVLKLQGRL